MKNKNKVSFVTYLKKYWFFSIISPLFMVGEVLVDLWQPKLMSRIINTVVESGELDVVMSSIFSTCLEMIILVAIGGFMGLMCCYTASRASQGFGNDVRVDAFNKVMSLSLEQTDKFTTGSLVTRLTNDITTLQDMVQMILRMFIRAPINFIGGLVMCLTLDISFGIVVLVTLPFILATVAVMIKKAIPLFSKAQKKLDNVNSVVQENVTGARVVKAYTREDYEINRFNAANLDYQDISLKASIIISVVSPIMNLIVGFAVVAIILIGGYQVEAATLNVGDIMAAVQYITQVLSSIIMISMVFQQIARGKACAVRVREVLESDQVIVGGQEKSGSEVGTVEFKNVSFKYPYAAGGNVLDDISFKVKKGETVAIIGATGSGKSSLVNLIPRFYDTVSGTVYVDGVDVRKWDLHALRGKIGFVLQKSELFSGSITDNIRWGDENATVEEVEAAAKIAQADEFVSKMEDGYESYVAEKGTSLSGGQKQRVAISRAIVRKPEIIIFDDSTSALDLSTEAKLRNELNREFKDTTIIMIAQRIASVMHADRIAVIENGKITAFDNHENLMKTSAAYRDIYSSQMKTNGGEIDG